MYKVWKEHENQYIRQNAGNFTDKVLAEKLSKLSGRKISMGALRKQRQKLNIAKKNGRGKCEVVAKATPLESIQAINQAKKPDTFF